MAIERVDFPINSMVDLSIAMLVHQRVIVILLQHHQHHNIIINNRRIISPGEALPCSNSCAKSTWWQGRHNRRKIGEGIPSGKRLHNYRKSPCYQWENPLFLWSFSIATLNYQKVPIPTKLFSLNIFGYCKNPNYGSNKIEHHKYYDSSWRPHFLNVFWSNLCTPIVYVKLCSYNSFRIIPYGAQPRQFWPLILWIFDPKFGKLKGTIITQTWGQ